MTVVDAMGDTYATTRTLQVGPPDCGSDQVPTGASTRDTDMDGVADVQDNCPSIRNRDQEDADLDGAGDACDPYPLDPDDAAGQEYVPGLEDQDKDGWGDAEDLCPATADHQADLDSDGLGDACDVDVDGDGVANLGGEGAYLDNCPLTFNPDQATLDADGPGLACSNGAPPPTATQTTSGTTSHEALGMPLALAFVAMAVALVARRK
jgi:hypothetical protein